MFGEDDLVKAHEPRAEAIGNIILIAFAIILARLWYLQIYQGDLLYQYSLENRLRKDVMKAPRGMVFGRNNELLIHNVPRFDAIIVPQYLQNKAETISHLSTALEMPVESITKILDKYRGQASYIPVVIKKNISRQEVALIETESAKLPGISVTTFISREYTDGEVGAHMLGYISEISQEKLPKYSKRDKIDYKLGDFIGQAGVEEEFDSQLRGTDGHQFVEVDARGRMKRVLQTNNLFQDIKNKPAKPGNNIRLTIDRDMQLSAFHALDGKEGAAIAIDVNSGEILAMVSRPAYQPDNFSKGITANYWSTLITNPLRPLRDRNIQEHYPPGSTFKPLSLIAALEEDIVDLDTEVACNGTFKLGRRVFHCWKKHGHGKVNAIRAIKESCDVYFYKIATRIDLDVLAKYAKLFGFGARSGVTLPRETTGLFPTKEWKRKRDGQEWQMGETLSAIIGQSAVLATPLQLALAYSAIANGGILYRPYIIKEIFNNNGEVLKQGKPEVISQFTISQKTLDTVREGLRQVTQGEGGTARWHAKGLNMSGKTGTSQVIKMNADKLFSKCEEMEYKFRNHGLFVAFAPSNKPEVAVAVIVEHGCSGSGAASPVAHDILETYLKKYRPELMKAMTDKERQKLKSAAGLVVPLTPVKPVANDPSEED